jgi:hypothetical protein
MTLRGTSPVMQQHPHSMIRRASSAALAISLVGALFVSACGGGAAQTSATTATASSTTSGASSGSEQHGEPGHHNEHHRSLSPALRAMHDVLAPVWHSEPGAGRDTRACEQAATLRERAGAAQSETLPADAPANAAETRTALVAAAQALVEECSGPRADVNGKLTALHTAFHGTFERR